MVSQIIYFNNLDIKIEDCRGQGYDGGSNMAGKNLGVQKRILDLNPRAFFVPCAAHKLNLVLLDVAESCVKSVTFFGTLQSVYNFISGSSQRWLVFKSKFPAFTLKPLSETRWAARFESVKVFRFQIGEVYDTLFELSTNLPD